MNTDRQLEMRQWVRAYLERDEDIIVPIKRMWREYHAAHRIPSLEEFTAAEELRRHLRKAGLEPPETLSSRRPQG